MTEFDQVGKSFGKIIQTAYLVLNIDEAMEQWVRHAGVGPWMCIRNIKMDAIYQEKPCELLIHEANSFIGDMNIQLVQSLNKKDEPTPYQSYIASNQYGVHHIAFLSSDIDKDVTIAETQGLERVFELRDKFGHRYFYCRSKTMPDVWFEFVEANPFVSLYFEHGIPEAANWDGCNPIRNFEAEEIMQTTSS